MTRWAKMDGGLDANPKICVAGRAGREIFLFLLRRNALLEANGELPVSNVAPEYLARQLGMEVTESNAGIVTAVTARLIEVDDVSVRILGWDEDWRGPKSNAQRQADFKRKQAKSGGPVTDGNEPKRKVTRVTKSNRLRGEEKRREKRERATHLPSDWSPDQKARETALENRKDVDREAAKFRDWAASKGEKKVDWNAAFRNWLRNESYSSNGRQVELIGVNGVDPTLAILDQRNAENERRIDAELRAKRLAREASRERS